MGESILGGCRDKASRPYLPVVHDDVWRLATLAERMKEMGFEVLPGESRRIIYVSRVLLGGAADHLAPQS